MINAADASEQGEHKAEPEAKKAEDKNPEEQAKQDKEPEHKDAAPQMANMAHHVMDGDKSRPLSEMMAEHKEMRDCMNTMSKYMKNDSEVDGGEKDAAKAEKSADLTKRNADEDGGEKEAAEQLKESDKTHKNDAAADISAGFLGATAAGSPPPPPPPVKNHFETLKNAPELALREPVRVDLDKMERGKARYGSSN